jgi:hypothetical protein
MTALRRWLYQNGPLLFNRMLRSMERKSNRSSFGLLFMRLLPNSESLVEQRNANDQTSGYSGDFGDVRKVKIALYRCFKHSCDQHTNGCAWAVQPQPCIAVTAGVMA